MLTPLLMADHVVDHLGEQHRLADARAAEQARLAAAFQRHQHIDGLDAGLENLGLCRALGQRAAHPNRDAAWPAYTRDHAPVPPNIIWGIVPRWRGRGLHPIGPRGIPA
jgi:hypothetical protein